MASPSEFKKASEIISTVKRADGSNAHIYDVLDKCHISLSWWKDHKKWFFYRHTMISQIKLEGETYLVYTKPEDKS